MKNILEATPEPLQTVAQKLRRHAVEENQHARMLGVNADRKSLQAESDRLDAINRARNKIADLQSKENRELTTARSIGGNIADAEKQLAQLRKQLANDPATVAENIAKAEHALDAADLTGSVIGATAAQLAAWQTIAARMPQRTAATTAAIADAEKQLASLRRNYAAATQRLSEIQAELQKLY